MKRLLFYRRPDGKIPIQIWLESFRDQSIPQRFDARFERLIQGNYGDCTPVGEGLKELRFHFGSGYRIYFTEDGDEVVLLLCGGDKGSQPKDIALAKEYLREYLESKRRTS